MNTEFPFAAAFQAFYSDDEAVKAAIDLATQQKLYGPSTACVELFEDGTYRVLPSVGNLYNSRGVLVSVPALQDDEISEDGDNWYDDAIGRFVRNYDAAIEA